MVFLKINLFINMAINYKVLGEKLKYIIRNECKEKKFNVLFIDVEFEESSDQEKPIESYRVYIKVDDDHGWSPDDIYSFTNSLKKSNDLLDECVSYFTITPQGKLVTENRHIYISNYVYSVHYELDEVQVLQLAYIFTYPD